MPSDLLLKGFGLSALGVLVACSGGQTESADIDRGFDAHPLSAMRPSIWFDPSGCQHWIIDDGVEGYLSNRLNRDGTPRCDPDPNEVAELEEEFVDEFDQSPRGVATASPTNFDRVPDINLSADAFFDVDSAVIKREGIPILDEYFTFLNDRQINRIIVEGHTDADASEQYNLDLSIRRAQAVAAFARDNYGIFAAPIGKGELRPAAPNDTPENKARNRRVEIYVLPRDVPAAPVVEQISQSAEN